MGSFSALRTLQLLVTTEDPITPSIERGQKLWEDKINPQVGDQGIPGRAHQAEPVIIVLRDPTRFPNQKQYPLKREARETLINKFLSCGLLVPTSSPCNTPVLSIKEKRWNPANGSRSPDHKRSCSPPASHSTQALCSLGRNPTYCQVVYRPGSQRCIFFAYHWLKNPNIFLPLSGRPQEKNASR